MTVKLSSLKADVKKESEGDWITADDIEVEDPAKPVQFLVRSTNLPSFRIARDAAFAKLARDAKGQPISPVKSGNLLGKLLVEHLLIDWRGLDEPYSLDLAMETLTDDAYRNVRAAVLQAAMKVGHGEVEFVEGAAKN